MQAVGARKAADFEHFPGRGVLWWRQQTGLRMTETLPDRLSVNPHSPHYHEALLARGVGIRFNGAEKTNVEEYCVSEGWIRVAAGRSLDRHGNPMTIKLNGTVEPYLKDAAPPA
jgi:hypothetical protein